MNHFFGSCFAFLTKGLTQEATSAMHVNRATVDDPVDRAAIGSIVNAQSESAATPIDFTVSLIGLSEIDDSLRAEWRELADTTVNPNPYFAPWFLEPAMRHLDTSEEVKLVLLRRAENSLLVALAPFVFQKGYAKLPLKHVCVWTHKHCFNGAPLIREGFSVAAYSAFFDWADTRPEGSVFIRFAMLPFDGQSRQTFDEACAFRDRSFRIQDYYERAVLTIKDQQTQEYVCNQQADLEITTPELGGHSTIADFIELESANWKAGDPDDFPLKQSEADSRFFREVMEAGEKEGAVRCFAGTREGELKATLFTMQLGSCLSAFKIAYDKTLGRPNLHRPLVDTAVEHMPQTNATMFDSCAEEGGSVVGDYWVERLPIVQVNIPTKRASDKILLGISARLEKLKLKILKTVSGRQVS